LRAEKRDEGVEKWGNDMCWQLLIIAACQGDWRRQMLAPVVKLGRFSAANKSEYASHADAVARIHTLNLCSDKCGVCLALSYDMLLFTAMIQTNTRDMVIWNIES
jgi:hypothetical protein